MFISIKKYLDSRPEQVATALLRMVQLLLQGIEIHAVKGDAADHEKFRTDMRKALEDLGERPVASEVLVIAGTVVKTLEEYNARTSKFIHIQCAELQIMVGMLTKAMTNVASGSETSVVRLQAIEKHLHKASMIEDFQTARLRLSECLENLRGEIDRHRQESARAVAEMKTELHKSQERLAPPSGGRKDERRRDPVTGLPGRSEAEAVLLALGQENRPAFAVLFIIERLELINQRYGYSAGDQVLQMFAQHVAQALSRSDRLFRWSGPSLVALLERGASARHVQGEVALFAGQRLEKTVQLGTRSVLLPISANWAMFAVAEYRPVQLLFQQFDAFIQGGQVGRLAGDALETA